MRLSLWLLSVSAAVVLTAGAGGHAVVRLLLAATMPAWLSHWALLNGLLSPTAAALSLGAIGAWRLFGTPAVLWGGVCAGWAGGIAMAVHQALGMPGWCAAIAPFALSAVAWWLARNARFAPDRLREQAWCALMLLSIPVAAAPLLQAGWQSAQTLNRSAVPAAQAIPGWMWPWVCAATLAGVVHSLWVRR